MKIIIGDDVYQIVRRGRTVYVRKLPKTVYQPTPAQLDCRLRFAEAATKARGKTKTDFFPPACDDVADAMSGYKSPYSKERVNLTEEEFIRRAGYVPAKLMRFFERLGAYPNVLEIKYVPKRLIFKRAE